MSDKQPPRRVFRYVREHPWAIMPAALDTVLDVIELRAAGTPLTQEQIDARLEAARKPTAAAIAPGSIAVLPLFGVIAQRMDMFSEISGGTSTENFGAAFKQALDDPNIAAIVLNVDSPGGSVFGVEELADQIYSGRSVKPVVAVANAVAASAAYWLGSQAEELVVTPSGEVGSIGVIAAHDDVSKMAETIGVKRTYITYGRFKAEGNPYEPLGDETLEHLKARLAEYGEAFVKAVARGRGVTAAKVRKDFGEGRVFGAAQAVAVGMADREGTLQETIDRLVKRQGRGGKRAEDEGLPVLAEQETPAVDAEKDDLPAEEMPAEEGAAPGVEVARARLRLATAARRVA